MGGGGGSTQNYEADFPMALLAREQWNDYKARFLPIERKLIKEGTSETQFLTEPNMARKAVNQSFDAQSGTMNRDMSRMGITMTPDQQAAADQNMNLAKASTMVGEANGARNNAWDRINGVMSGGLSSVDRTIRR